MLPNRAPRHSVSKALSPELALGNKSLKQGAACAAQYSQSARIELKALSQAPYSQALELVSPTKSRADCEVKS